ncbi:hypothetical protein [uncultured Christiangramia sp.]|uniref:hypothetical protein n=1 Tax=uncultured Christiangramia sp. TaxID=503836 RepID=UPI0026150FB8|nr:hypothetical protein [uncultured Christiangramia sp.]
MKKILPFLLISMMACNSEQNTDAQKQTIVNFLQEDAKGIKTDLKIEVSQLEVSDITVEDSIAILNKRYEEEKASKIEMAENALSRSKKDLNKKLKDRESQSEIDKLIGKRFIESDRKSVEDNKKWLEEVQNFKPDYLDRYEGRNNSELLVKKAETTFSFFNPSLQTRQERTDDFVFSKDGSEVLGIMQNGKLRRKKKN